MSNIKVGRYQSECGYQGWIEPEDKSWIIFVKEDGRVEIFDKRDPETGAVL